ncbi:MAG: M14 family zinc carboxypeptidase, partial [Candidatus Aminicenantales bacterium]
MTKRICSFIYLFFILLVLPASLLAQTSPEAFLGHKVGADRRLADYDHIQAYFRMLDEESGRVKVLTIGKTTLGKPMIMAVITAEKNMERLDLYREITRKLRDARGLTVEQAEELSESGRIIIMITCSLHSDEIGASQMAMELAYRLAADMAPFDVDEVLQDVIVLLVPTTNPDGHQMVTDWYRKYVGTEYEGSPMPWLYHPYAGHDNNRDWFMLNLDETRIITKVMYNDWIPQIHLDAHEMGPSDARFWIPPFANPPNPNVHPLIWRGIALCAMNMAYDLQKNNFSGVEYGGEFIAGWWDGACDNTPWFHNTICLLTEAASVRVATPIDIDPSEIPEESAKKSMECPDPWPGGRWRLRDIVDYELTASMSLIETASLHKKEFLFNFYRMCRDSIEKREEGQPFAFVIPGKQWDDLLALKMLEILMFAGVEINQAKEDFIADGKTYPAGSFVILMSQPYRAYAQAVLERQKHPEPRREYPGGPFVRLLYDNAGWTLPLQMGVECEPIFRPFQADLIRVNKVAFPRINPPQETAPYVLLDSRHNASYSVIFSLLQEGAEIYRSKDIVMGKGFETAAGSFILKNTPLVQKMLPSLLEKWHVEAHTLESVAGIPKSGIKKPLIALYQSWRANMDEGWTRYVFDDLSIPYTTLRNEDFKRRNKDRGRLKREFDVIVFADEDPEIIIQGKRSSSRVGSSYRMFPPEYEGGIGKEGVEALKSFVEQGGVLVTLNNACRLVLDEFQVPARNALAKVDRSQFFCPGSILRVLVDNTSPIGYG